MFQRCHRAVFFFFLKYISEIFFILKNKLIGYADDSTLMAVVPSQGVKVRVAESLIRDFGRVSKWYDFRGMKLNVSKHKTMSLQVTNNESRVTPINCWRNRVEGVWWPWYIGSDMWFQDDLWEASSLRFHSSVSKTFYLGGSADEYSMIGRFLRDAFWGLSCPFWSTVLQSGARFPIRTLKYWDVFESNWGVFECGIAHRQSKAVPCVLYKIRCNPMHPFHGALPVPYAPVLVTRGALSTIGILLCLLAAVHRSTAGSLFPS